MKWCDDRNGSLLRYIDQELCGLELVEFRTHLEECAACRQKLEAEEELSRLLYARLLSCWDD
jgi:predicted anti-sigma-YlaC factor YlaD